MFLNVFFCLCVSVQGGWRQSQWWKCPLSERVKPGAGQRSVLRTHPLDLNTHLIICESWLHPHFRSPSSLWIISSLPPSSVSFDTPPPTASMCLLISLKTHTKYRFCDMKSSQIVQKTNDESFCIRNYFTLLCIMFLHNFYLYMTIKEYK